MNEHTPEYARFSQGCAIHSMIFYRELDVLEAAPVCKKKDEMEFLTKSGIRCISRSSLGTFILCGGTRWLGLFLFAKKKMKFLTKGGIRCISRPSLGTFILCAGAHWSN